MDGEKDLKYWIDLWKTHEHNTKDQQEFWDNRADFFNEKVFSGDIIESNIVDLLKDKNMLGKDMKVLDIGCGPGKHTLPMARVVKSITALDISENMLDYLKDNMKKTNIWNINPINLDWKGADLKEKSWEKAFDLVLASQSPGICNYETLEKMITASKKYCYLSSFVRRQDLIGDEIRKYVYMKYNLPIKKRDKIYCVFNILWQLGYLPEVQYKSRKWEDEMSVEEAYSLYKDKMSSMVTLTDQDREKIKKILDSQAHQGKVTEKTEVTQGILTWEVESRRESTIINTGT